MFYGVAVVQLHGLSIFTSFLWFSLSFFLTLCKWDVRKFQVNWLFTMLWWSLINAAKFEKWWTRKEEEEELNRVKSAPWMAFLMFGHSFYHTNNFVDSFTNSDSIDAIIDHTLWMGDKTKRDDTIVCVSLFLSSVHGFFSMSKWKVIVQSSLQPNKHKYYHHMRACVQTCTHIDFWWFNCDLKINGVESLYKQKQTSAVWTKTKERTRSITFIIIT